MQYLRHPPGPPLAHLVDYLWSLRDVPGHAMERIVPSGTLELVVNLDEDEVRVYGADGVTCRRFAGAVVSGAYRKWFTIDTREHASIVGVHFKPGGALPVLGVPPGTLADQHVELDALWPRFAGELREQLCAAATPATRFEVLEQALLVRLGHQRAGNGAVTFALDQLGPCPRTGDLAPWYALTATLHTTGCTRCIAHIGFAHVRVAGSQEVQ